MPAGTLYRGREGMWSWVAHRVTGVLIFFFLFVHVLDTALVRVSPEDYDKVVATYKTPIVSLLEYGLVAAILFHALNGLRIIAVDYWTQGPALPEADALDGGGPLGRADGRRDLPGPRPRRTSAVRELSDPWPLKSPRWTPWS